ncbi:MAG: hypothetical protein KIS79_10640 [Burkholderiales bacterium]|nr:hypothetical protein [Burkholderiales bacterium]
MPLALCCDDPSEVRWREIRAWRSSSALQWGEVSEAAQLHAQPDEPVTDKR